MFNTNSNLLSKSGLSVDQINSLLAGHGKLAELGQAFIDVENRDGVNAFWGMAQAIEETGWGVSAIAEDKNNLFGITAFDANPYGDASSYASPQACVEYWGDFISKQYLKPGGAYYVSPTPAGVARHWATDPNYAAQVVDIMNLLVSRAGGNVSAPAPVAPAPMQAASGVYVVQAGENMSGIAQRHGLTLTQLEAMNPHAGHPSGNFNVIWPSDHLVVSGSVSANPVPANGEQFVTVQKGDNLSTVAARHGISLPQIEALNPHAGHPAGHFDTIWPGDSVRIK